MKRIWNIVLTCYIWSIIYLFPVSSRFFILSDKEPVSYNIFLNLRLTLVLAAVWCILLDLRKVKKDLLAYLFIMFAWIFKALVYREMDFGFLYFIGILIIFDYLYYAEIDYHVVYPFIKFSILLFLLQVAYCTYINREAGNAFCVVSSIVDRNYTGYFLMMLVYLFFYMDERVLAALFFLCGLFTYSRLFIIAALAGGVIAVTQHTLFSRKSLFKVNIEWYVIFQIATLILSVVYVYLYEKIDPEYVYITGFRRLLYIFDESNYIRFLANILALTSITFITTLIGVKEGSFKGLTLFVHKTIFPHNAIWSLFVSYGFLIPVMYINRFIKIFRGSRMVFMYFIFIVYHCILGPSSFYGVDILILLIISKCLRAKEERVCV